MIHFKILEKVLDEHYFCYNPGGDGQLYHLVDDCMFGFTIDFYKNILDIFDLTKCDFPINAQEEYNLEGYQHFEYPIPEETSDFLDLLHTHKLLFINESYEEDKKKILDNYFYYLNENTTNFKNSCNKILNNSKITMLEKSLICREFDFIYNTQFQKNVYKCDKSFLFKNLNEKDYITELKMFLI